MKLSLSVCLVAFFFLSACTTAAPKSAHAARAEKRMPSSIADQGKGLYGVIQFAMENEKIKSELEGREVFSVDVVKTIHPNNRWNYKVKFRSLENDPASGPLEKYVPKFTTASIYYSATTQTFKYDAFTTDYGDPITYNQKLDQTDFEEQ